MTPTELANLATNPAIQIWNTLPEQVRVNALSIYGTKEEAISELAMAMLRNVASKLAK
jgi:hypothetical protein